MLFIPRLFLCNPVLHLSYCDLLNMASARCQYQLLGLCHMTHCQQVCSQFGSEAADELFPFQLEDVMGF